MWVKREVRTLPPPTLTPTAPNHEHDEGCSWRRRMLTLTGADQENGQTVDGKPVIGQRHPRDVSVVVCMELPVRSAPITWQKQLRLKTSCQLLRLRTSPYVTS